MPPLSCSWQPGRCQDATTLRYNKVMTGCRDNGMSNAFVGDLLSSRLAMNASSHPPFTYLQSYDSADMPSLRHWVQLPEH